LLRTKIRTAFIQEAAATTKKMPFFVPKTKILEKQKIVFYKVGTYLGFAAVQILHCLFFAVKRKKRLLYYFNTKKIH